MKKKYKLEDIETRIKHNYFKRRKNRISHNYITLVDSSSLCHHYNKEYLKTRFNIEYNILYNTIFKKL